MDKLINFSLSKIWVERPELVQLFKQLTQVMDLYNQVNKERTELMNSTIINPLHFGMKQLQEAGTDKTNIMEN